MGGHGDRRQRFDEDIRGGGFVFAVEVLGDASREFAMLADVLGDAFAPALAVVLLQQPGVEPPNRVVSGEDRG